MTVVLENEADELSLEGQLADLLIRLCTPHGDTLKPYLQQQLTALIQHVSRHTRAGMIAVPLASCPLPLNKKALLALPAVGEAGDYAPLIIEKDCAWLYRYWDYEQRLAHALANKLQLPEAANLTTNQQKSIETQLQQWFSHPDSQLQRAAVELALKRGYALISGGPGTGKTTIVVRILSLLVDVFGMAPGRLLLAAPTGKAAMRLQESIHQAKQADPSLSTHTPEQVSTVHRLLGYSARKQAFRFHRNNPLPADVVLIDEASMLDISLMTQLLEAMPTHARLIMLGDRDQLASVETGSVFRDLCSPSPGLLNNDVNQTQQVLARPNSSASSLDKHQIILMRSWRFGAESGIGQLAKAVRSGQFSQLKQVLHQDWPDISWQANPTLDLSLLLNAWQDYLQAVRQASKTKDPDIPELFHTFNRFRILTPLRLGAYGTEKLNQSISQYLSRHLPDRAFSHWFNGRPIMIKQNDYRQNVFNGDIGLCLHNPQGQAVVWFAENNGQDNYRSLAPIRLPVHETAWAMTIHKSQGSEFEHVLLLLAEQSDNPILGRELLYTGITRASRQLDIIADWDTLNTAINQVMPDTSLLRQRLQSLLIYQEPLLNE